MPRVSKWFLVKGTHLTTHTSKITVPVGRYWAEWQILNPSSAARYALNSGKNVTRPAFPSLYLLPQRLRGKLRAKHSGMIGPESESSEDNNKESNGLYSGDNFQEPGIALSTLPMSTHLSCETTVWNRHYYYHSYFMAEELTQEGYIYLPKD